MEEECEWQHNSLPRQADLFPRGRCITSDKLNDYNVLRPIRILLADPQNSAGTFACQMLTEARTLPLGSVRFVGEGFAH